MPNIFPARSLSDNSVYRFAVGRFPRFQRFQRFLRAAIGRGDVSVNGRETARYLFYSVASRRNRMGRLSRYRGPIEARVARLDGE